MDALNKQCPNCGHEIDEESQLICMYCGKSLTPSKKYDALNSDAIGKKDEDFINTVASLGTLWWVLIIFGGIASTVIICKLAIELL